MVLSNCIFLILLADGFVAMSAAINGCGCDWATNACPSIACCPGLRCIQNIGNSICQEDPRYLASNYLCTLTMNPGCGPKSPCCNPAAVCVSQICRLPCSLPTVAATSLDPIAKVSPTLQPFKIPSQALHVINSGKPLSSSSNRDDVKPSHLHSNHLNLKISFPPWNHSTAKSSYVPSEHFSEKPKTIISINRPNHFPCRTSPKIRLLTGKQSVTPALLPSPINSGSSNVISPIMQSSKSSYSPSARPSFHSLEVPFQTNKPSFQWSNAPFSTLPMKPSFTLIPTETPLITKPFCTSAPVHEPLLRPLNLLNITRTPIVHVTALPSTIPAGEHISQPNRFPTDVKAPTTTPPSASVLTLNDTTLQQSFWSFTNILVIAICTSCFVLLLLAYLARYMLLLAPFPSPEFRWKSVSGDELDNYADYDSSFTPNSFGINPVVEQNPVKADIGGSPRRGRIHISSASQHMQRLELDIATESYTYHPVSGRINNVNS